MRLNLAKANQAKKGLSSGTKGLIKTLRIDVTLAWCRRHVQNKVSYMNIVEAWYNDWIDAAKLAYSIEGPQLPRNMLLGGYRIMSKPRSQASNQGMIRSTQQAKGPHLPGIFCKSIAQILGNLKMLRCVLFCTTTPRTKSK